MEGVGGVRVLGGWVRVARLQDGGVVLSFSRLWKW